MPMSMENLTLLTPQGVKLLPGGATFKVWAPRANQVHVIGQFSGQDRWTPNDSNLMNRDNQGYWIGFLAGVADGDEVKYFIVYNFIVGTGSQEAKRHPKLSLV